MKWLIVSTNPEPNVPGTAHPNNAGWNIGDVFARLGTEAVIREVDTAAEFDVLNVDDADNVNRERPFDRVVLAGRPLFFPNWRTHHVWTHVLRGWPGRDRRKIMALGVGDCYPWPVDVKDRDAAIAAAVRETWRTTVRFPEDGNGATQGICPASWLLLNRPEPMTRKLCNLMRFGGHYPTWNMAESGIAIAQQLALAGQLIDLGFEFVAHCRDEWEMALELGWPDSRTIFSDEIDPYLDAYASASHYIGNRMHGAVILAGRIARSLAIGYDSRTAMVHEAGCSVARPSQIDRSAVFEFAQSTPGQLEVARTLAIRLARAETVKLVSLFAGRRVYVQLGRVGDVLNVLPLLKRDADRGIRGTLVVAEEFAAVLEGVTYLNPAIWPGDFTDIVGAGEYAGAIAKSEGAEVVVTQIYGEGLHGGETCSSFVRESWDRAPGSPPWGSLPLVFDRRDLSREVGIANSLLERARKTTATPYIVLALSGTSSPFRYNLDLIRYLRNKLGKTYAFVDVSGFTAPRFYDLLTLLEGAHALVTIDSALLHLAAAVPSLRVIAFVVREPSPWHGTAWRRQQVARFFYDEAPEVFRHLAFVISGFETRPKIWHTWSQPLVFDEETDRRMDFARATWKAEYANADWRAVEFEAKHERRNSAEEPINDPRPMPFVRDLIDRVEAECPAGSDVIAYTNADVSFVPGLTGWIFDAVLRGDAAFTHRWDFARLDRPLANEAEAKRGTWYPGSDAFFFTVAWWRRHRDEYPDMIYGREHCDEVLRQLIKRHGGREIRGAIYHEKHASFWEAKSNADNPGNQHNRRLARRWFLRNGYGPNDPEWWKLPG